MAMFPCPDCNKLISKNAEKCPKCGRVISQSDVEAFEAQAEKNKKIYKKLGLVLLAFFAVLFVAEILITPKNATSAKPKNDISSSSESIQAKMTTGQKNALKQAKNYLDIMAFSYSGLIKQLEYEKYTTEDATYAADNCGADWNEQAVKKAKEYLAIMSFSKDGLIKQLEYDGFSHSQAEYGAKQNGY